MSTIGGGENGPRFSYSPLPLPSRGLFGRSPTHVLLHRRRDRKVALFRSTPHGEFQSCSWRSANLVKRFTPAIFPRMSKRPYGIRLPASGTDCAVSFNPASWMSTPWIEATSSALECGRSVNPGCGARREPELSLESLHESSPCTPGSFEAVSLPTSVKRRVIFIFAIRHSPASLRYCS